MQLSAIYFGVIYFAVAQQPAASAGTVTLDNCHIYLESKADIPSQEGGVIKKMFVKEGQDVKPGDPLVQIEDDIPSLQTEIAKAKLEAAQEQAINTVPEEYARASRAYAIADHESAVEANKKAPGTYPAVMLKEKLLKVTEMDLSIKKAQMDQRIAQKSVGVQQAEMNLAQTLVDHRLLRSPLEGVGVVSKIKLHMGEWVQAGQAVLTVEQMDVMRAEGELNVSQYAPYEIIGKPVTLEVELRGRKKPFEGKIVFIDPEVRASGGSEGPTYRIRAEVENKMENRQWLLRDGMMGRMTIQLK